MTMAATASIDWDDVEAISGGAFGEFDAPCPSCGPDRRGPANRRRKVLRVWRSKDDYASFYCTRCGARGWVRPSRAQPKLPRGAILRAFDPPRIDPKEEAREAIRRSAWAEFIFLAADPIKDSLAERYLASRGLIAGDDLRFHNRVPHRYEDVGGSRGMIAAVRNRTGAITGIQATYLSDLATKQRRTTFGRVVGGAVRLAPVGPDGVLGIAEGTETALAFTALYGVPCWAALSAVGIERFEPPPGLQRLIIAGDNDDAGMTAARRLAQRACAACEVVLSIPDEHNDWADVLAQKGRAA